MKAQQTRYAVNRFVIRTVAHQIDELSGDLVEAAGLDEAMDGETYEEARTLHEDLLAEFHGRLAGAGCTIWLGTRDESGIEADEMEAIYLEDSLCVFRVHEGGQAGGWVRGSLAYAAQEAAEWREARREATAPSAVGPWDVR